MKSRWGSIVGCAALVASACAGSNEADSVASLSSTSRPAASTTALDPTTSTTAPRATVRVGAAVAADTDFVSWSGARVGLISHRSSMVGDRHVADLLAASENVELVALFGPEHGVRGTADAGEDVPDSVDVATGVPVHSLYGDTRQPTAAMLENLDVLFYDLQDVGARYYTYISTMGLAMQAAAELDVTFVVFDRPNPLGDVVGGDMRGEEFESFVGMYPIAERYGLTPAELAHAIKGEQWLPGLGDLDLQVVLIDGWSGEPGWPTDQPWIEPSPAITRSETALLYPATVLLEATTISLGRGTPTPFELVGAPRVDAEALLDDLLRLELPGVAIEPLTFTPRLSEVISVEPLHLDKEIDGLRLVVTDAATIRPTELGLHLLDALLQQVAAEELIDRPEWLDRLTGSSDVRETIERGGALADLIPARRIAAAEFATVVDPYRLY
ncbi:MAG: exo-beta-N-acetylmuramidase NamZ family protein [Acidimicrobiales bacterium]